MRILFVEDFPPLARFGAGLPRARSVLEALLAEGHSVTLYATQGLRAASEEEAEALLPAGTQLLEALGPRGLLTHLAQEAKRYDALWVCRKHNMAPVVALRERMPGQPLPPVIYDTEALEFRRNLRAKQVRGEDIDPFEAEKYTAFEARLAGYAQVVVAVSAEERDFYLRHARAPTVLIAAAVSVQGMPSPVGQRNGLLFLGAINDDLEPNADALGFFMERVWPLLGSAGVALRIAGWGTDSSPLVQSLRGPGIEVLGPVSDIATLFDAARVFVAPTRFAAGIPLKVIEAAGHGLPVVATPLLAAQLGWSPGVELLTGATPQAFAESCLSLQQNDGLWAKISAAGSSRATQQFSAQALQAGVREVLAHLR